MSRKSNIIGIAVFAATAWAALSTSGTAFAATRTWTGTDCPTTNCNWSNGNNWQGGVAPVNGDDIVITGNAVNPDASALTTNDIPNLTINSLAVSGYDNVANSSVHIADASISPTPLTIAGNITYTAPTTAAPSGWYIAQQLSIEGALILGGNSTFTQVYLSSVDNTLNLNGHTLTFNRSLSDLDTTSGTLSFSQLTTGSGTININVPATVTVYMNGSNTYSGTTNINSVDYVTSMDRPNVGMFGTSTINLSAQSRILYLGDGAQTISNIINVTPPTVTGTFLSNQLEFWSSTAAVTFTVPNVHLLGNARFGMNELAGSVTVNLAGIITNGHCIQYGDDNYYAANFQNGPSACVVAVASAPNTGFALLSSNPLLTFGAALLAGAALIIIGKKAFSRQ